jgi:hypothetical protein
LNPSKGLLRGQKSNLIILFLILRYPCLEKSCGSDDCSFFSRHTVIQRKAQEYETAKTPCMKQWIKDTAGLGTALWLIGYLASLVLFFSPFAGSHGLGPPCHLHPNHCRDYVVVVQTAGAPPRAVLCGCGGCMYRCLPVAMMTALPDGLRHTELEI